MSIMREFLRSPRLTGAIAPSSPTLAQAMTAGLDPHRADVVVTELTGRFSRVGAQPVVGRTSRRHTYIARSPGPAHQGPAHPGDQRVLTGR
ncbi:hypothetical protein ACH49O_19620 [Streptomyces coeruleorubidus]|uniref:hypothetical protein n=1 Tax=Streptomyces coeruleorubidus TaxID=116188 RepID=UPI00340F7D40